MATNVVPLGLAHCTPPGEACEEVVALLREWLEAAERGELVQVLIAGVRPIPPTGPGGVTSQWAGVASRHECLAAATALQARVSWAYVSSVED